MRLDSRGSDKDMLYYPLPTLLPTDLRLWLQLPDPQRKSKRRLDRWRYCLYGPPDTQKDALHSMESVNALLPTTFIWRHVTRKRETHTCQRTGWGCVATVWSAIRCLLIWSTKTVHHRLHPNSRIGGQPLRAVGSSRPKWRNPHYGVKKYPWG